MTLDLFRELRARDEALESHESNHGDRLEECRAHLRMLCRSGRPWVCADDVRPLVREMTAPGESLNWVGAVFRTDEWEPVGFTRSKVEGSHGNLLRTWRYLGH